MKDDNDLENYLDAAWKKQALLQNMFCYQDFGFLIFDEVTIQCR